MIVSDSLAGDLIGVVVAASIVLITYCKWTHQYWKRRNLQFLEPTVPFGNVGDSIKGKENLGVTIKRLYGEMKAKGWKHGGIYVLTSLNYIPVNLDYVKNIMAKDFQYFVDRTNYLNEKEDPLNAHLVNLGGTKWRNMRTKLTPTFTSGKMKMMFQTLADCQVNLLKKVDEECAMKKPLDIKELLACFTTDIIGSCAFGLDFNSFEQENSPFRLYGKKVFTTTRLQRLKKTLCMNFPELALYFNISTQPKDITDFFIDVVKDTIDHREKKNYTRNDFMQLLIDMKNGKQESGCSDGKSLRLEEVAAQSFVFFLAGFETSSTLMTFALYELARHPDIQEKVRSEVETVLAKYDGEVSYDAIQDMKYMNQVIDETFRMHPPVPGVNRKCVKDSKVPDEDLVIQKGTTVIIPILGIHYDAEYYPEPEKFDPDRFSDENKKARHAYSHLPFGEGPRICIGMRFGLMQSKVGLSCLLKNYRFTVNRKTQEPLKMQPDKFILSAVGEIWLDAQKI